MWTAGSMTPRHSAYLAPQRKAPLQQRHTYAAAHSAATTTAIAAADSHYRSRAAAPETASFMTQARPGSAAQMLRSATPRRAVREAPVLLAPHSFANVRPLLVLDLDETLVHASIERVVHDVALVVVMDSTPINVYVKFRPYAKQFLRHIAQMFEVCVFTASLPQYADQVVDLLDPSGTLVHHRLFREHCTNVDGSFVKDLSRMGRRLESICIVDNSPVAYSFHPQNALPIESWFEDPTDKELLRLLPTLESIARCGTVYSALQQAKRVYL